MSYVRQSIDEQIADVERDNKFTISAFLIGKNVMRHFQDELNMQSIETYRGISIKPYYEDNVVVCELSLKIFEAT